VRQPLSALVDAAFCFFAQCDSRLTTLRLNDDPDAM
jgi:hypothetical protein